MILKSNPVYFYEVFPLAYPLDNVFINTVFHRLFKTFVISQI